MLTRLCLTLINLFFPPLSVLLLTGPYTDTLVNCLLFIAGVMYVLISSPPILPFPLLPPHHWKSVLRQKVVRASSYPTKQAQYLTLPYLRTYPPSLNQSINQSINQSNKGNTDTTGFDRCNAAHPTSTASTSPAPTTIARAKSERGGTPGGRRPGSSTRGFGGGARVGSGWRS